MKLVDIGIQTEELDINTVKEEEIEESAVVEKDMMRAFEGASEVFSMEENAVISSIKNLVILIDQQKKDLINKLHQSEVNKKMKTLN